MYTRFLKRIVDLVASVVLLLVLSPVLFGIAGTIRLTMGKPILFRQVRIGLHEDPFVIVKFRTMSEVLPIEHVPDNERITRLGRLLRATSLDELPELWNVLRGEMSLVGPRPLLPEYLPHYNRFQRMRHSMRPGLTGLAQISGRNEKSWTSRFQADVWYCKHVGACLDLWIAWNTVLQIFSHQAIRVNAQSQSERFISGRQGL